MITIVLGESVAYTEGQSSGDKTNRLSVIFSGGDYAIYHDHREVGRLGYEGYSREGRRALYFKIARWAEDYFQHSGDIWVRLS